MIFYSVNIKKELISNFGGIEYEKIISKLYDF